MKDLEREGWKEVTVKDLCSVKTGKKDVNQGNPLGKYPFFTCAKQHTYSDEWSFDGEALLIAGNGDVGNLSYCNGKFEAYQRTYVLMDFQRVLPQFLYYVFDAGLKPMLFSQKLGNTMPYIKKGMITDFPVPLPPLEEQHRIVAVLDEAFEGLARARAHAEANLRNARELFQATLHQSLRSATDGWRTLKVEASLTRTKVPNKIQRKAYLQAGEFPIVSQEAGLVNGYWDNAEDLVQVKRPLVVFGDHTRILKYVDFDFVVGADGTQIMAPVTELDPRFYYYALKTIDLQGKGYARHFSHLKKCEISFPCDEGTQQEIADRLDLISDQVDALASAYSTSLSDIDALRQSILQKAFAGELT